MCCIHMLYLYDSVINEEPCVQEESTSTIKPAEQFNEAGKSEAVTPKPFTSDTDHSSENNSIHLAWSL